MCMATSLMTAVQLDPIQMKIQTTYIYDINNLGIRWGIRLLHLLLLLYVDEFDA